MFITIFDFIHLFQLAVQFTTWDRIRDIASHSSSQSRNLAQYISYLISHGGIPVSVLKIIEFGALDKLTMRLVRQILLSILLGDEETCKQVSLYLGFTEIMEIFH